jgi:GNAT superfamily N-acetyltransferase
MLHIIEIGPERLNQYELVPQRVEVRSILEPRIVNNGLGGILLDEVPIDKPYIKDYDSPGNYPSDIPKQFDVSKWGFFLTMDKQSDTERPAAAAIVAFDTTGVNLLEERRDLSVLWDVRVCPEYRGAGIALFRHTAEWSRIRGCQQMKVETQNVNVPACRFYQRMGCRLGEIRRFGYAGVPAVANEVMLCWYLDL